MLACLTITYHKNALKSRDYSGLYGIKLIIFCVGQKRHETHLRNDDFSSDFDGGKTTAVDKIIGFISAKAKDFRNLYNGHYFGFVFQH